MKTLYCLSVISLSLFLMSCATTHSKSTDAQSQAKDPIAVSIENKPKHSYKVIGKASISKYNAAGIKRQEALLHDTLRELAASLGGDAVINVKQHHHSVTGTVISYGDSVA